MWVAGIFLKNLFGSGLRRETFQGFTSHCQPSCRRFLNQLFDNGGKVVGHGIQSKNAVHLAEKVSTNTERSR